jgi:hypothetical protein
VSSYQRYLDREEDLAPESTVWWVDEDVPTIEVPVVAPPDPSYEPGPWPGGLVAAAVSVGDRVGAAAERLLRRVLAVVAAVFVALGVFWAVPWAEAGNAFATLADAANSLRGAAGAETMPLAPAEPRTAPDSGAPDESSVPGPPGTNVPELNAPGADPKSGHFAPGDGRAEEYPGGDQGPPPTTPDGASGSPVPSAGPVTQAAVDRLKMGMTIDEVTRTIGVEGWDFELGFATGLVMPSTPALIQLQHADTDLSRWALRQWPVEQFGPAFARVVFRDGRAVEIDRN